MVFGSLKSKSYYDSLEIVLQHTGVIFDPENPISRARHAGISDAIIVHQAIEGENGPKDVFLIKADDIFKQETLTAVKRAGKPDPKGSGYGSN